MARVRFRRNNGDLWVRIAAALTVAAPLITFGAVLLTRNGIVTLDVGLDLLTIPVAQVVAWIALAFSLASLVLAVVRFRQGIVASAALALVCAAVAGAFFVQSRAIAETGPLDVSSDLSEPPAVPGATGAPVVCEGVEAVRSQVAPKDATDALQAAGFKITESQLFRSRGVKDGFWFGMGHEAVIRIRPDRTDVRVVARYNHTDGGATCRIAAELVAALQPGT